MINILSANNSSFKFTKSQQKNLRSSETSRTLYLLLCLYLPVFSSQLNQIIEWEDRSVAGHVVVLVWIKKCANNCFRLPPRCNLHRRQTGAGVRRVCLNGAYTRGMTGREVRKPLPSEEDAGFFLWTRMRNNEDFL